MDLDNRKVYGDTSITDGLVLVYFSNNVLYFAIICCLFFESGKTRGEWFTVQILVVVVRQGWWRALAYLSSFCN